MRVAIDIRHLTDPRPAGVGSYTVNLLHALFGLDPQTEYILLATGTPRALANLPHFKAPNVAHLNLPIPNKIFNATQFLNSSLGRGRLMGEAMAKLFFATPDLIFFPNLNFFQTKLPYVITAHDLSYKIFPDFFSKKMRSWHRAVQPERKFREARAVLCPSESTKRDLIHLYNLLPSKIHVTPLAASSENKIMPGDSEQTPIIDGRPSTAKPYLLSLATLEPRKNQLTVIKAFEKYRDTAKDEIDLVLAGAVGWMAEPIIRAAQKSRYAQNIRLIGYVPEAAKGELYCQAELFIFPSFYEGFGLPILEAMSYGIPTITSQTGALPEVTADAALLVDPFNINDLCAAISELRRSEPLRRTLRERGLKRARVFSWEKTAGRTLKVFHDIIAS